MSDAGQPSGSVTPRHQQSIDQSISQQGHAEPQIPPELLTTSLSSASLTGLIAADQNDPDETSSQIDETSKLLGDHDDGSAPARYDGYSSPNNDSSTTPTKNTRKRVWKQKLYYYVPGIEWIPRYRLSQLTGDILGGVTVASMLIPQSVSYASSLAHLSPVSGLLSASIPPIAYAILGRCPQLNVAPEAALSLMVGSAVQDFIHNKEDDHEDDMTIAITVATAICLQVGFISFLLGFLRLGFMDVLLSRAMLHGFITAVAVIILIEQLIPMFGLTELMHAVKPDTTLDKFAFFVENVWTEAHRASALISITALFVLILLRYTKKRISWVKRMPEVFIVVVISTLLSAEMRWDNLGVAILGTVPIHFGTFTRFPISSRTLPYLQKTTSTAATICVVGFLDSIVAAKQNAMRFGYSISPNRELTALGVGNMLGSFFPGCLPASGSITRSRINADMGATSQMASLVCAALILLATFVLLPLLHFLPKPVLGSIICLIVISLLEEAPHALHFYWTMRSWIDLTLMILTFAFIIVFDVEIGIMVAVIISLLLVVHRSSKTRMTILGHLPGTDRWKPISENPEALEDVPGALIVRLRESLDFANSAQLKERLRRLELGTDTMHPSAAPLRGPADILVFHLADLDFCDASATQVLFELFQSYKSRKTQVFITHLRPAVKIQWARCGIVKLLGEEAFFNNLADAMRVVERLERA